MEEKEFFNLYRDRLQILLNSIKEDINELSSEHASVSIIKIQDYDGVISVKGNFLISELMKENKIPDILISQGLKPVPLSSVLYLKSISIQQSIMNDFRNFKDTVINEIICRDYPEDCLLK